jgi:hypothetical protein
MELAPLLDERNSVNIATPDTNRPRTSTNSNGSPNYDGVSTAAAATTDDGGSNGGKKHGILTLLRDKQILIILGVYTFVNATIGAL